MIVIRKGFLSILLYDSFKDFIIMDRPNFAFTAFIFWLYSIYIYFMGSDPINSELLYFRIFYFSVPAASFVSPHAPHTAPLSAFSSGVGLSCDGEPSAWHRANVGLTVPSSTRPFSIGNAS